MSRPFSSSPSPVLVGSVALVAAGVASNAALTSPYRRLPALLLIALGVAGVATAAREYAPARLRRAMRRWWLVAFATFLPYALTTAPATEPAAAVGAALDGPIAAVVLESIAGAAVCCAVATTVLYGFAAYGIHPDAPTPEERILSEGDE